MLKSQLVPYSSVEFHLGNTDLIYCDTYRYLGLELNEYLDYTQCVDIISGASSRALGGLVSRYYNMHGLHYETYTKLYQNHLVIPVMDYASAIWGYKDHPKPNTVQHRAMRCFMGSSPQSRRFTVKCAGLLLSIGVKPI